MFYVSVYLMFSFFGLCFEFLYLYLCVLDIINVYLISYVSMYYNVILVCVCDVIYLCLSDVSSVCVPDVPFEYSLNSNLLLRFRSIKSF